LSWYQRLFARDLGIKALSVAIATTAWIVIFGYQSETIATTYEAPIVYRDVPPNWLLDEPKPVTARVTLSGSQHTFEELDLKTLSVSLPLAELREGAQLVRIADDHLTMPSDLAVHRIEPRRVLVVAHRTVPRIVRVRAVSRGSLRSGLRLAEISVSPERVELLVKASEAGAVEFVSTEPIDLTPITTTTSLAAAVLVPPNARLPEGGRDDVTVRIEIMPTGGD
jgi:hypothetical protein